MCLSTLFLLNLSKALFDSFCIARWRMDVHKGPPNLKKEHSKRLGTCSMLFELVENEWLIFNKNTK